MIRDEYYAAADKAPDIIEQTNNLAELAFAGGIAALVVTGVVVAINKFRDITKTSL